MGRKKKEFGAKEKKIFIRVTEDMHELISYKAEKSGLSISEFCRRVLLNQPIKKLPIIIHDEREIAQALRNINANINGLGNILNQTARHLNEGGEINDALLQEMRKTLTTLDISINDFNRAVEKEYGKSG